MPVLVSLLMVIGTAVGVVLATTGGKPAAPTSSAPIPSARPTSGSSAAPVVPLLAGNTDANGAVPAVTATPAAFPRAVAAPKVAPLRGLRQADLLVVAPFTLSGQVRAEMSRQPGVTSAEPLEAAKVTINGSQQAVLGVDPSTFRAYAAGPTAASNPLWQGVAGGGVAVSYTMGTLDKLSLGGGLTVTGRQQERLRVVAFGTVGIGGVDAVVSDSVARSLGMPAANAIVISAPPASVPALVNKIKGVLPRGASVEPLVTRDGPAVRGRRARGQRVRRGRGHELGPADHGPAGRGEQAGPALRVGRRRAVLLRLLRPGAVVIRPGRGAYAAGRRRPGQDRARGPRQPAAAR